LEDGMPCVCLFLGEVQYTLRRASSMPFHSPLSSSLLLPSSFDGEGGTTQKGETDENGCLSPPLPVSHWPGDDLLERIVAKTASHPPRTPSPSSLIVDVGQVERLRGESAERNVLLHLRRQDREGCVSDLFLDVSSPSSSEWTDWTIRIGTTTLSALEEEGGDLCDQEP